MTEGIDRLFAQESWSDYELICTYFIYSIQKSISSAKSVKEKERLKESGKKPQEVFV